jgi:hypothetical protein
MAIHDELVLLRVKHVDHAVRLALIDLAEIVDEMEEAALGHGFKVLGGTETAAVVFFRNQNKARNAFAIIQKAGRHDAFERVPRGTDEGNQDSGKACP